jgi:triosephosphate isomerase
MIGVLPSHTAFEPETAVGTGTGAAARTPDVIELVVVGVLAVDVLVVADVASTVHE